MSIAMIMKNRSREITQIIKNHFVINWTRQDLDYRHQHHFVSSIKHQLKNISTHFIVTNAKKWNILFVIATFLYYRTHLESSIRINSYEKSKRTCRIKKILSLNREKNNFHQKRDEEQTKCQDIENRCVQFRRFIFRR
jgi:hypothetical protein